MVAFVGDDAVDGRLGGAEVGALNAGIDVIDRLDVRLIIDGLHLLAVRGGHVAEQVGDDVAADDLGAGDRDIVQRLLVVELVLRRLHGEVVRNAVRRRSVQKFGVTCSDELRLMLMSCAT